jgi:hypothetical protein
MRYLEFCEVWGERYPAIVRLWDVVARYDRRPGRGASTDVSPITSAYLRARDADPKSSYGDFVALSHSVDEQLAESLGGLACDGLIAPGFEPGALERPRRKKNGRSRLPVTATGPNKVCRLSDLGSATGNRDQQLCYFGWKEAGVCCSVVSPDPAGQRVDRVLDHQGRQW